MTDFKRRTLYLKTGKQIKLFGNSMAIGKSLEVGEGAAPNLFCFFERQEEQVHDPAKAPQDNKPIKQHARKIAATVSNPQRLTPDELYEIADYNIRLWMDLKDKIREFGVNDPKVFNIEVVRS